MLLRFLRWLGFLVIIYLLGFYIPNILSLLIFINIYSVNGIYSIMNEKYVKLEKRNKLLILDTPFI